MIKKRLLKCNVYVCFLVFLNGLPVTAYAIGQPPLPAAPTGLVFTQVKMTGDEFLLLKNNSGHRLSADETATYWLYDFNNVSPLSNGVSSSQQQLPAISLDDGQTVLLSATSRNTCGATIAGKLGISLTDSGGFLQLVRLTQDQSGSIQQSNSDVVSWSSGTAGSIQNIPSSSKDPQAVWYRYAKVGDYAWQAADVDTTNNCQLNVVLAQTTQPVATTLIKSNQQPPSSIVSLAATGDSPAAAIPAHDVGLAAPQISELLPNPDGTGNDDTDEFIELYNVNPTNFDLSGFSLQTGTTTKHSYIFPAGTSLSAKSFKAFYSSDTGLSLSNTSGLSDLLDPLGNQISQTGSYGVAKDGQAWALAKGKWYWTSQGTPNAANVIKQSAGGSQKSSSKSKTATKTTNGTANGANSTSSGSFADANALQVTPIHPWTLAIVVGLAVAYGIYEYRLDLANRLYQFRKHRADRRANRPPT